jgi:hypothetical protein
MIKLNQKLKDELWWLVIGVDYDYSRISIADHEINGELLIRAENMNSYEGTKIHPQKGFVYKTRIEINEPLRWYRDDASPTEQQWAREAALKSVLTQLIESEVYDGL